MFDDLNYLNTGGMFGTQPSYAGSGALNEPASAPSFWSNLVSGIARGYDAGGGLQGLMAGFDPTDYAQIPYLGNKSLGSPYAANQQPSGSGMTSNAQAASTMSGGLGKLGGFAAAGGL